MSSPTNKVTEFADLVKFFQMLASRRDHSRVGDSGRTMEDDIRSIPVPGDLEPVFRNLASLVDSRYRKETTATLGNRSCRNTVTSVAASGDCESVDKFPLGQRYPFTFKMMLHKLYELEEWGQKVKDVLEKSQRRYKSLHGPEDTGTLAKEPVIGNLDGQVHFGAGVDHSKRSRGAMPTVQHSRGRSVGGVLSGPKAREEPAKDQQKKVKALGGDKDNLRAVKKRCIGRRKSTSSFREEGQVSLGRWVYNAAISLVDGNGQASTRRRRLSLAAEGQMDASIGVARPIRKRRGTVSHVFGINENE